MTKAAAAQYLEAVCPRYVFTHRAGFVAVQRRMVESSVDASTNLELGAYLLHWQLHAVVKAPNPYAWVKKYSKPEEATANDDHAAENRRLKRELARVTEERDILKKATVYFAKDAK